MRAKKKKMAFFPCGVVDRKILIDCLTEITERKLKGGTLLKEMPFQGISASFMIIAQRPPRHTPRVPSIHSKKMHNTAALIGGDDRRRRQIPTRINERIRAVDNFRGRGIQVSGRET